MANTCSECHTDNPAVFKFCKDCGTPLIQVQGIGSTLTMETPREELTTVCRISHKSVCRIYDLGKDKARYDITREYISGEDLKSFLRRSGRLSVGKGQTLREGSLALETCPVSRDAWEGSYLYMSFCGYISDDW